MEYHKRVSRYIRVLGFFVTEMISVMKSAILLRSVTERRDPKKAFLRSATESTRTEFHDCK